MNLVLGLEPCKILETKVFNCYSSKHWLNFVSWIICVYHAKEWVYNISAQKASESISPSPILD